MGCVWSSTTLFTLDSQKCKTQAKKGDNQCDILLIRLSNGCWVSWCFNKRSYCLIWTIDKGYANEEMYSYWSMYCFSAFPTLPEKIGVYVHACVILVFFFILCYIYRIILLRILFHWVGQRLERQGPAPTLEERDQAILTCEDDIFPKVTLFIFTSVGFWNAPITAQSGSSSSIGNCCVSEAIHFDVHLKLPYPNWLEQESHTNCAWTLTPSRYPLRCPPYRPVRGIQLNSSLFRGGLARTQFCCFTPWVRDGLMGRRRWLLIFCNHSIHPPLCHQQKQWCEHHERWGVEGEVVYEIAQQYRDDGVDATGTPEQCGILPSIFDLGLHVAL